MFGALSGGHRSDTLTKTLVRTSLLHAGRGIYLKNEAEQPGGHKLRAVAGMLDDAEAKGIIEPDAGDIIIEKSGGNLALGLAACGLSRGYRIRVLVRPGFSETRRRILAELGVELIGFPEMERGWSNKQIIEHYIDQAEAENRRVFFPDQFSNPAAIKGHQSGARELVEQLRQNDIVQRRLTFIHAVGTGASLCAYAADLRAAFGEVRVVVAEPESCSIREGKFASHPFQGVAVGVIPPLFDASLVDDYLKITVEEAWTARDHLTRSLGRFFGPSTALVFAGAIHLREQFDDPIVMIAFDRNDPYFSDHLLAEARQR